jgi:hypothetical protein
MQTFDFEMARRLLLVLVFLAYGFGNASNTTQTNPSESTIALFGANISPKQYEDTIDNNYKKVAVQIGLWNYSPRTLNYGYGYCLGFEGEWGENHKWMELRFYAEKSYGLYFIGHQFRGDWSFLYQNFGGVSIGPILELTTKSIFYQGLGLQAGYWHFIGPLGGKIEKNTIQ